jgi:hypothetical protein
MTESELPEAWRREFAQLREERAAQRRSLDSLSQLLASMNQRLDQLSKMLRRREEQLARSERENRRLRRELGLDDDEPDPDGAAVAVPDGSAGEAPGSGATGAAGPDDGEVAGHEDNDLTEAEGDEEPDPTADSAEVPAKKARPRSRGGRRGPPEHLPRDHERHEVCACGACGGRVLQRDVLKTPVYTVVPSYVRCRLIERERVVCADCGAPTTASMPPMPVARGLYDCRFLAWLVVMKFVLLVPLDRVRTQLQSKGIDLAMGTLVHLIDRAATLLDPIDGEHLRQLRVGAWMCFDGTGLKTLVIGQDKAWDGYLEVFTRDELTVFQFDMTKHADQLAERLGQYRGILVADAESRNAAGAPEATFANCNAHPLRKFRDAERVQPKLAKQGQRFIQALYELEDIAADEGLFGEERVAFRQRRSRRVLHRFHQWLEGVKARGLPPSDPLGKVVRYYLAHFEDLSRFIDHAELPLDNNAAEREFQRHAKLRLASLFAGSEEGAHRWATLLGVVRTAQKCDLDVESYLTWVFERRGSHRARFAMKAAELTPMAYREHLREQAYAALRNEAA